MSRPTLSDLLGLRADLEEKLASENGDQWMEALKKMLRKENPWPVEEVTVQPVFKLIWQQAEEKAYDLLGLKAKYAEFRKEHGIKEIAGRWVLPMVKGITCAKIIGALKKSGSGFWSYYDDLDKAVVHNDRDANRDGSYLISFLPTVEADEENKNKSANKLKEEKHQGITLMERLFLELVYFLMTGNHLDIKNVTLCSGSRDDDGDVPDVHWHSGSRRVRVRYSRPSSCVDGLRSRFAVSLPAEPRVSAA